MPAPEPGTKMYADGTIVTVTGPGEDDETFAGTAEDGEQRTDWLIDECFEVE